MLTSNTPTITMQYKAGKQLVHVYGVVSKFLELPKE